MPAFLSNLSETDIRKIAIHITEQRNAYFMGDFKLDKELSIPQEIIETEEHAFRIETVAKGLDTYPYSIAPLPDGRILLTEKRKGLRIIATNGDISPYIQGLPNVYEDGKNVGDGIWHGLGWILDVALHPEFEDNGWIYVSHGDRCDGCNEESKLAKLPVSMIRLIRGRIDENQWVDQEIIWETDINKYTAPSEVATGARICFDAHGYVYMSLGGKKFVPVPEEIWSYMQECKIWNYLMEKYCGSTMMEEFPKTILLWIKRMR